MQVMQLGKQRYNTNIDRSLEMNFKDLFHTFYVLLLFAS